MDLQACLPAEFRAASPVISPIAAGLSGAGVYRVEAAGQAYVLKLSDAGKPLASWRRMLQVQLLAAEAGLAPRVVHAEEARRAVLSDFAGDRPFGPFYGDPRTRPAALALLGRTLRRVHELPLPPGVEPVDPREALAGTWSALPADAGIPPFAGDAVRRALTEPPPGRGRAPVLSHNDVNPSNLVLEGERLMLVDWEHAGANDPLYDLASISVFLNLDDAACRTLLAAYQGGPVSEVPAGFAYNRRLVAALCGAMFLRIARQGGYCGAGGEETPDSVLSLGDLYQRMRAGSLSLATGEGQWRYGLALIKASLMP